MDVEASGPSPGGYSLLSLGACLVDDPERSLYLELQPISPSYQLAAMEINGLSLEKLSESGLSPKEAMARVDAWLREVAGQGRPVFVAFNAPFDWMFVEHYFQRFLGHNPFGHSALDMKAYYMALTGCTWTETGMAQVNEHYGLDDALTHNALEDAQHQARLFALMLAERHSRQ